MNLQKGKYLFHEGDNEDGFYIILNGKISVCKMLHIDEEFKEVEES